MCLTETHFVERDENRHKILQASFSKNRINVPLDAKKNMAIVLLVNCTTMIFFQKL